MTFAIPLLVGINLVGGLLLILFQKQLQSSARVGAILAAVASTILSVAMLGQVLTAPTEFSFEINSAWVRVLGARWHFGVDSISMWMIALSSILGLVSIIVSKPEAMKSQYYGLILIMSSTLHGVFASLDLLAFYTFYELSLIPTALMILGWGTGNRKAAATKYLGFLFLGSLPILISIATVFMHTREALGSPSLDIVQLQDLASRGLWQGSGNAQAIAFWGLMIGLLVKSPAVPGHTWIADAYESAPIGAILSGLVVKVGTYGMFRFVLPLFPDASRQFASIIVVLGVIGIIYGGLVAAKQDNPYRLMAYSTISHVGYILVGLFSLNELGMVGAAFQQVNHGIASGAVMVLLAFLATRVDVTSLSQLGGLKRTMPVFSTVFLVAVLANLGLPFTSGFVGEILALVGGFQSAYRGEFGINMVMIAVAAGGAILSAVYMLTIYQRIFYGVPKHAEAVPDLNSRELTIGGGFACIILILGVVPMVMLESLEPAVKDVQGSALAGYHQALPALPKGNDIINPNADHRNRENARQAR